MVYIYVHMLTKLGFLLMVNASKKIAYIHGSVMGYEVYTSELHVFDLRGDPLNSTKALDAALAGLLQLLASETAKTRTWFLVAWPVAVPRMSIGDVNGIFHDD